MTKLTDNTQTMNGRETLWRPPKGVTTNLDRFRNKVNDEHNLKLEDYFQLYQWSIANIEKFWPAVWDFCNIISSKKHDEVIDLSVPMNKIPQWFNGARLNYAENCLRWDDDHVALICGGEGRPDLRRVTYKELKDQVARFAAALKKVGVEKGDRVCGYMPNCMETAVAMLATASIGAIWSSTSPDFGAGGVLDRFAQIDPKVLLSVNAVAYNGKVHDHMSKLRSVVLGLQGITKVVVLPFIQSHKFDVKGLSDKAVLWGDFIAEGNNQRETVPPLHYEQLPFNHPLFIMYSSGTTGAPKCMVHSAGGCIVKHLEEHVLQSNLKREDVFYYYTTTGWMMWNWLMGGMLVGATLVLYDGSPSYPTPEVMWDKVDKLGITVFGTSAKWLATCMDLGQKPKDTHKLTNLRAILSTGAPLAGDVFNWVYQEVKEDLLLGSISGGTDICSCFVGSNPTLPVVKGEIQSRHLGMAIEVWDEDGNAVTDAAGELVCIKPFPCMPIYFWNDPDGKKYQAAYFEKFPGVWAHGDFALLDSTTSGMQILGRSDGVLNPSGVRFGSSEIYNVVQTVPGVEDSLCVGKISAATGDESVVLFVMVKPGVEFNEVANNIRHAVRKLLSPRHVPRFILETKGIPYTINGKKVEVAVKQLLAGRPVKNASVLADPTVLDFYRDVKELKDV